jgi:hypothetical protein
MYRIRDRRNAEFDPSFRQHDDEFRTTAQIEIREQMTDVSPYRNVLKSHSQRNGLGAKSAYQPRQRFELSWRDVKESEPNRGRSIHARSVCTQRV